MLDHIKFNEKVLQSRWDPEINQWRLSTESGQEMVANVIITGTGALHVPKLPDFPGMEEFQGESFHTAHWRKHYNPQGEITERLGSSLYKL